jgi:peptidoglycan/LPS O-acetylase OafA/YrhL
MSGIPSNNASTERATSAPAPKRHIAPLDGLRGLAVLLVLLFHLSWSFPESTTFGALLKPYLWAGWLGVDLFFVLSGYLITRGLVKDSVYPTGKRLRLFWARRAFRIFPLYYIVLIAGSIVCLAVGASQHLPGLGYWLYFQNYTLAFDPMPLRWTAHFWSLAIEEQFYFVWPLFVLFVSDKLKPSLTIALLLGSMVLRAALLVLLPKLMHWDAGDSPEHIATQVAKLVYRATPTHMDGLLVGALLAILEANPEHSLARLVVRFRRPVFSISGMLLLMMLIWTRGFGTFDRRVMVLGMPLLAVFFGACIVRAVRNDFAPWVDRLLSRGVLSACGKVSYGMYIFHWGFVALLAEKQAQVHAQQGPALALVSGASVVVAGMLLTYGLAWLSYRFVEAPFLKLKEKFHD